MEDEKDPGQKHHKPNRRLSTLHVLVYFSGAALATFVVLVSVYRSVDLVVTSSSPHKQQQESVKPPSLRDDSAHTVINSPHTSQPQTTSLHTSQQQQSSQTLSTPHKPSSRNTPPSHKTVAKTASLIDKAIHCPAEWSAAYRQVQESPQTKDNFAWCKSALKQHRVQIGRSWGSLSGRDRLEWDGRKCNELMSLGTLQSCSERWGWDWFKQWMNTTVDVLDGGSHVSCMMDVKTTTFCEMKNVAIDYSKMSAHGGTRSFSTGFLSLYGYPTQHYGRIPTYPGIQVLSEQTAPTLANAHCEEEETRPTFILSNDDVFNLGHYMNDVMTIWNMFTLANRAPENALLINIDGVREGGPAGGPAHRLMLANAPDTHGPYSEFYFHKWFADVQKGIDNKQKRVCYKNLYFFPLPGVAWFWNNWGRVDDCSTQSPSPLYQSFNVFLRQRLIDALGESALPSPPTDHLHIVIEVRKINPRKRNAHASSRFIANLPALVDALQTLPNVRVTTQDFAALSFLEQIKLAHSASILMSMHGAGTTHIFHMALGEKNCCGLVELFPDPSVDLHTAHGYGNLARMLGLHHARYVAQRGSTQAAGTTVDVDAVKALVKQISAGIATQPSCLLDVKDTREKVFGEQDTFAVH